MFRPRQGAVAARVAALSLLVVFVALAVLIPSGGAHGWDTIDRVLLLGLGVAVAAFLWRYARLRAVPSPAGLRVVNLLRSRDLEWAEILRVGFSGGAPWVVLERTDTDEVPVMAIQRADGAFARAEAARLSALVEHHARAPGPTG